MKSSRKMDSTKINKHWTQKNRIDKINKLIKMKITKILCMIKVKTSKMKIIIKYLKRKKKWEKKKKTM